MSCCLDSTTAIDLLRGRSEVRDRYSRQLRSSGEPCILSVIVVHELVFGVRKRPAGGRRERETETLLADAAIVPLEIEDARAAAALRAELEGQGRRVELPDLLIAAQARERGWTVVTSNVRHFGRVPGLEIIDWRVSDAPLTSAEIAARLV